MRSLAAAAPVLAVALFIVSGDPALGEERKMNAGQIREALTGNTVEGKWGNTPYRSYFQPNGVTIYKPKGGEADMGKWRVDEENDQYCSWWARSGWGCYDLYRDGRRIIWGIPNSETRYPSKILPGKQL